MAGPGIVTGVARSLLSTPTPPPPPVSAGVAIGLVRAGVAIVSASVVCPPDDDLFLDESALPLEERGGETSESEESNSIFLLCHTTTHTTTHTQQLIPTIEQLDFTIYIHVLYLKHISRSQGSSVYWSGFDRNSLSFEVVQT